MRACVRAHMSSYSHVAGILVAIDTSAQPRKRRLISYLIDPLNSFISIIGIIYDSRKPSKGPLES